MNNETETKDDLLSSKTYEALVMFIESQCSLEEIYAIFDMTDKQLEKKFKIKTFESFYTQNRRVGQAKIKASQYNKAISGNAEMLKWLTRNVTPETSDVFTVVELPDNNRVRK